MINEFNTYSLRSLKYEKSVEQKKKTEKGIFYTTIDLTKTIMNFLSIPSSSIVLDPCCGTGSFLLSAKSMGVENIFGADIDKKAVDVCKETLESENIVRYDTLSNNANSIIKKLKMNEKADYIVGNPPYVPIGKASIYQKEYLFNREVKDCGNNLFIAALLRSFDLSKETGIISYIIPKNFLHVASYGILRKRILTDKTILSIVDLGACFKDVRGEQILLTIKNSKPTKKTKITLYNIADNQFNKTLDVLQSDFENEIILFKNKNDCSIFKTLSTSYETFNDICTGYVGRGRSTSDNAITGKDIIKFAFKGDIAIPKTGNKVFIQNIYSAEAGIIASFAGNLEASETVTVFTDGDEKMCRYIVGVLHSRLCNYFLYKFCYNSSKLTMHTDAKYLKKIPLIKTDETFNQIVNIVKTLETTVYLSKQWFEFVEALNALVYKAYDISEKDKEHIEKEMKIIHSQRWCTSNVS